MHNYIRLAIFLLLIALASFAQAQSPNWTNVGPIPFPTKTIAQVHGIGRCSQLKFHPTDPNKMYTPSASGGLWYSADKGVHWTKINTDQITKTQSASVAIDPTNDQVIYWGTGDANYYGGGVGIYKTTNGGANWTLSNSGMGNVLVIEILIDPANTQNILAATDDGIYKSTNGGSSWTLRTAAGLQFQDMVLKAVAGTSTVYACTKSAFYISNDWGTTWTTTGTGLVMDGGGARIAVTAANTNVVYVGVTKPYGTFFRSTDGGANFTSMRSEMTKNLVAYNSTDTDGGQGNYNFDIVANPANANEVYLVSHIPWRTTDAGSTWTQQQATWAYNLHTDHHQILFDPWVSGQLWSVNDGGIWSNTANGTGAWTPMSDGLAATEIYHGAISKSNRQVFYIGTQDNGGFYYNSGTWYNDKGGDWGPNMWFDYGSNYYGEDEGNRKAYPSGGSTNLNLPVAPNNAKFAFTPANTNIGYYGNAGKVYRCTNLTGTPSWTLIYTVPSGNIKDLQVDPSNADVLYVFTDAPGLYRSDNATSTATFVTLTTPNTATVGSIAPCPNNTGVVYMGQGTAVFRSANKGASWTATTGFPTATIVDIAADPKSTSEAVYASYALGVYYKDNTLSSWVNYANGLPIVCNITDMDIYNDGVSQGVVNVYYYGRGVWQSNLVPPPSNITVAITSPTTGTTYNSPATINIAATASVTSGSITKVEFYNGTTLLGTSTTAPYTYSWTGVPPGTYTLTAVAYDDLGNQKSSSAVIVTVVFSCAPVTGTTFGTSPAYAAGSEYDKAFDGNTSTFFDFSGPSTGYTGLDLGTAKIVTGISYYPRSGQEGRMNGGAFQGSNTSTSTGFVTLYTIPSAPASGWTSVTLANNTAYRYYRYVSPTNGYCNVAEIQFCLSNQPPVVSITAPADNTLYPSSPSTVNITATASDPDGTISKVEFYYGSTLIGTDLTGPYSFSWTGVTTGTYQITAKAYDNLNATATSSIITIIVGNQNPIVSITSPGNGSIFDPGSTINITANASDPDGTISKVEFYNGNTLLGTDLTGPYSFSWVNVGVGTYNITAVAYDNLTGVATSSVISISVPCYQLSGTAFGTGPAYYANSQYDKAFDGNTGTFFCNGAGNGGYTGLDFGTGQIVKGVEFYPQWTSYMTGGRFQASNDPTFATGVVTLYTISTEPASGWNIVTFSNNTAYRYYRYIGANGTFSAVAEIIFCGANLPPVVSITSPLNNATLGPAPANISITATASDPDGTISRVDFYQGAVLIGTATTGPYTITWNSVPNGTYQLTAIATDNKGASASSTVITVYVNSGLPVSFVYFEAKQSSANTAQLEWSSVNGYDVRHFVPEYSADASTWMALPEVAYNGNTVYTTSAPLNASTYYRITVVNQDGSLQHSDVRYVDLTERSFVVYPNPVTGKTMTIEYTAEPKGEVIIRITDMTGKEVLSKEEEHAEHKTLVNVEDLVPGTYIVTVQTSGTVHQQKIIRPSQPKKH